MRPCPAVRGNSGEKAVTFSKAVQSPATGPKRRLHANLAVCAEERNLLSNNSELHVDCTIYYSRSGETGSSPDNGNKR